MFKTPEDRLSEIQLYELVAEELEQGEQSKGLWAKALAEGEGNIEKAKGLYIKLRVEMIKDEWAYAEKVAIDRQKQLEEEYKEERKRADRQNQDSDAKKESELEQGREKHSRKSTSPYTIGFAWIWVTLFLTGVIWLASR